MRELSWIRGRGTYARALLALTALTVALPGAASDGYGNRALAASEIAEPPPASIREGSYGAFMAQYSDVSRPNTEIVLQADKYAEAKGMQIRILNDYEGQPGASLWTDEEGSVTWNVDVPSTGLYNLQLLYYPIEGKSAGIERRVLIDGKLPYLEADSIIFSRIWGNESDGTKRDPRGNDIRARQVEKPRWLSADALDSQGYYPEPLSFYLTAGNHSLTFESLREPMLIRQLKLYRYERPRTYDEVAHTNETEGWKPAQGGIVYKTQGEAASAKSDPTLYPLNDRTSPASEPYDVSKIRMNMIGGNNWRLPGQWIEWEVEAPEDGLYRIAFKSRQNALRGMYATRKLTIDGEVPFKEAEQLQFMFKRSWRMFEAGEEKEPYLYRLAKGKHTIRLQVSLGDIAPLIRQVENSVLELNNVYRQIVKITGTAPDVNRDYHLDRQIPRLQERLREQSEVLEYVGRTLEQLTGERSDRVAPLYKSMYQLEDLAKRPETIQKRLVAFRDNMGALGTWILTVREQPLDIDYLLLTGAEAKLPKAEASGLKKMGHEIGAFFYSFFEDYNSIGSTTDSGKRATVWIGSGRDQAQVIKQMIDDSFTPQTGIEIDLKLVNMGVLLPATLAGQGPDVAMNVGAETPVNFAMRGAAQDLTVFPDYEETTKRFYDSALVPFRYRNKLYALPETQTFAMLFYRKDVLAEMGLEVPQSWNDLFSLIPELQKHNMQFAFPLEQDFARMPSMPPNTTFMSMLLQAGGRLYADDGKGVELDSEASMQSFKQWVELYTSYKLPLIFDFPNRFRTGEMPIGIADYSFYNHLSVSAPELRGLWGFAPIPGTPAEGGVIRRDEPGGGSSVLMLQTAKNKDNGWAFMKWWTDTETQVRFGREMEGLMGAAARYPTANVEALAELPWPVKDLRNLQEQWKWVQGVPEVPGSYFTGRHLDNAFRKSVAENTNARETLYDYIQFINDEIATKRREFKLPE